MTPFQEEVYNALLECQTLIQYASAPGSHVNFKMIQHKLARPQNRAVSNKNILIACQKLKDMGLIVEFDNNSVSYKIHYRLFRVAYPTEIVAWKKKQ